METAARTSGRGTWLKFDPLFGTQSEAPLSSARHRAAVARP
jgi:hypothetical protein